MRRMGTDTVVAVVEAAVAAWSLEQSKGWEVRPIAEVVQAVVWMGGKGKDRPMLSSMTSKP